MGVCTRRMGVEASSWSIYCLVRSSAVIHRWREQSFIRLIDCEVDYCALGWNFMGLWGTASNRKVVHALMMNKSERQNFVRLRHEAYYMWTRKKRVICLAKKLYPRTKSTKPKKSLFHFDSLIQQIFNMLYIFSLVNYFYPIHYYFPILPTTIVIQSSTIKSLATRYSRAVSLEISWQISSWCL